MTAQEKKVEWTFPRPGMETKKFGSVISYQLGNDFYGVQDFDLSDGLETPFVILPSNIDALIDNVNKSEKNGIPDKIQFIVALCIDKAVVTPKGKVNKYIGRGKLKTLDLYMFEIVSGGYVGGIMSSDKAYVTLLPLPSPK